MTFGQGCAPDAASPFVSSGLRGRFPYTMVAHPAPLRDILLKLCRREDLTRAEARDAFDHVMSGDATDAQIGGLLVGLAAKGTTVEEPEPANRTILLLRKQTAQPLRA